MSAVRFVVSDLDGTLLPRSGKLGRYTREVLSEVRRRGIRFSIATGRLFHHALPIAAELGLTDPVICCDGALTRSARNDDITRELFLAHETAQEAFAQLFFYADAIFLIGRDVIYAAPDADTCLIAPWGDKIIRFNPREELPESIQAIVAFGQNGLLAQASELLHDSLPEIQATVVDDMRKGLTPLIVRPRKANKGDALADLRTRLLVRPSEVMVFGDWPNDLPMFAEAGYSIAPRNAHPAVKRAASRVSAYTSEEEFVAKELEDMLQAL